MGRRLALLIATYQYRDAGLRQLTAPAHDAEALAAVLSNPAIADFEVTTLINEPHHVVGRAVGEFYRDRRRDDLTLLYFTGHGVKDDDGRLYLAMSDTLRDNLLFTAVSAEQIDQALESCLSRRKVLILDCCYSGAFPAGRNTKAESTVHTTARFQGRGRTVLTASDATQYSFEGNQISGTATQSVFTKHLVAGLRDGSADLDDDGDITLDELYSYVYDRVVEEMPQQRPKKQDNVEGRTIIARNINWALPAYLRNAIDSPFPEDRLAALDRLNHLRRIGNDMVRAQVDIEIRRLADYDSKAVSEPAALTRSEPASPGEAPIPAVPSTAPKPIPPPASTELDQHGPTGDEISRSGALDFGDDVWHDRPRGLVEYLREVLYSIRRFVRHNKGKSFGAAVVVLLVAALTVYLLNRDGETAADTGGGEAPGSGVIATLTGFPQAVSKVTFSAKGDLLAASSDGPGAGTTHVWRLPQVQHLNEYAGHNPVFSPDGSHLALAREGAAQLINLNTADAIDLPGHAGNVQLAFSHDGKVLATAATSTVTAEYDNPVHLWEVPTGKLLGDLTGHTNGIQSLAFSSDDQTLVTGAAGGSVRVWDMASRSTRYTLTAGDQVMLNPQGNVLAISGWQGEKGVQLIDLATGRRLANLGGFTTGLAFPVSFSTDGEMLAVAGTGDPDRGAIFLWRTGTGGLMTTLRPADAATFARRTLLIISAGNDAKLFDTATLGRTHMANLFTFTGHLDRITTVTVAPDGRTVATGSADKTVRIWEFPA
ncbi:caspase family protein [Nocardia sp. NPDC051321]|uniref:caspase, EACC1-associated type n=1 Tax=Nocardia sp. NPDC051321 TaxID=3364323 RepID=UPI00379ACEAA